MVSLATLTTVLSVESIAFDTSPSTTKSVTPKGFTGPSVADAPFKTLSDSPRMTEPLVPVSEAEPLAGPVCLIRVAARPSPAALASVPVS